MTTQKHIEGSNRSLVLLSNILVDFCSTSQRDSIAIVKTCVPILLGATIYTYSWLIKKQHIVSLFVCISNIVKYRMKVNPETPKTTVYHKPPKTQIKPQVFFVICRQVIFGNQSHGSEKSNSQHSMELPMPVSNTVSTLWLCQNNY